MRFSIEIGRALLLYVTLNVILQNEYPKFNYWLML